MSATVERSKRNGRSPSNGKANPAPVNRWTASVDDDAWDYFGYVVDDEWTARALLKDDDIWKVIHRIEALEAVCVSLGLAVVLAPGGEFPPPNWLQVMAAEPDAVLAGLFDSMLPEGERPPALERWVIVAWDERGNYQQIADLPTMADAMRLLSQSMTWREDAIGCGFVVRPAMKYAPDHAVVTDSIARAWRQPPTRLTADLLQKAQQELDKRRGPGLVPWGGRSKNEA